MEGKKYIIEVEEAYTAENSEKHDKYRPSKLYRVVGFNSLVFDSKGLAKLIPYTEKESDDEAYERGLHDAWWTAKKVVLSKNGLTTTEVSDIFLTDATSVFNNVSPKEAYKKINEYEKKKTIMNVEVERGIRNLVYKYGLDRVRNISERLLGKR